jgi:hypothetical protein
MANNSLTSNAIVLARSVDVQQELAASFTRNREATARSRNPKNEISVAGFNRINIGVEKLNEMVLEVVDVEKRAYAQLHTSVDRGGKSFLREVVAVSKLIAMYEVVQPPPKHRHVQPAHVPVHLQAQPDLIKRNREKERPAVSHNSISHGGGSLVEDAIRIAGLAYVAYTLYSKIHDKDKTNNTDITQQPDPVRTSVTPNVTAAGKQADQDKPIAEPAIKPKPEATGNWFSRILDAVNPMSSAKADELPESLRRTPAKTPYAATVMSQNNSTTTAPLSEDEIQSAHATSLQKITRTSLGELNAHIKTVEWQIRKRRDDVLKQIDADIRDDGVPLGLKSVEVNGLTPLTSNPNNSLTPNANRSRTYITPDSTPNSNNRVPNRSSTPNSLPKDVNSKKTSSDAGTIQTGQSSTLKQQRARFAKELDENPALRAKVLAIAAGENLNKEANISVIETMMNRAAMAGTSLAAQATLSASEHGYYAGYSPGNAAKYKDLLEDSLKTVLAGSNVSNYSTGNASGAFVERRLAQGLFPGGRRAKYGGESFVGEDRGKGWKKWVKATQEAEAAEAKAKSDAAQSQAQTETAPAKTRSVNVNNPRIHVLGDSLAVGVAGKIKGSTSDAKVGIGSGEILRRSKDAPDADLTVISSGTNDPGNTNLLANLRETRKNVKGKVVWVMPLDPRAAAAVQQVMKENGDKSITYTASPSDSMHLHPSDQGYKDMAEQARKALQDEPKPDSTPAKDPAGVNSYEPPFTMPAPVAPSPSPTPQKDAKPDGGDDITPGVRYLKDDDKSSDNSSAPESRPVQTAFNNTRRSPYNYGHSDISGPATSIASA